MFKQKIGISLASKYDIPMNDVLQIIKNVGFDAVSPIWENESSLDETVTAAKALGLEIQSLHCNRAE